MTAILNLTQHPATSDQVAEGVVSLPAEQTAQLRSLLNFATLPSREELSERAAAIAQMAAETGPEAAMIGGAPYLMGPLEAALREQGIAPMYAFSERRSVESTDPVTGEVTKTSVFVHLGFVEA